MSSQRSKIFIFALVPVMSLLVLAARDARADGRSSPRMTITGTSGGGYASTAGGGPSGWGYQAGGRLQFSIGGGRYFGFEASYIVPVANGSARRYVAMGAILEQEIWSTFVATVGTIGYVGVDGTDRQPFGARTELGFVHWFGPVRLSLTYRSDLIFATPLVTINSASAGLGVAL